MVSDVLNGPYQMKFDFIFVIFEKKVKIRVNVALGRYLPYLPST